MNWRSVLVFLVWLAVVTYLAQPSEINWTLVPEFVFFGVIVAMAGLFLALLLACAEKMFIKPKRIWRNRYSSR